MGLERHLGILRLYSEQTSHWTVQKMAEALGQPTSSVYRVVRDLVASGFLEPSPDAQYRLGPAFIEYERLIRLSDPLLAAGGSLLPEIALQAAIPCVAVLARLYGDTVMCVADASPVGQSITSSFERGRPMPLMRGATSKMILAQLPARRLEKALTSSQSGLKASGAAETATLRRELAAIRRRGYCVTIGEVDGDRIGLAAPVAVPRLHLVASLSLVIAGPALDTRLQQRLLLLLVSSASLLTEQLNA